MGSPSRCTRPVGACRRASANRQAAQMAEHARTIALKRSPEERVSAVGSGV